MNSVIKKLLLLLLLIGSALSITQGENNRLGILATKATTLVFKDDIIDLELASQEYYIKIKGRYLLIRTISKPSFSKMGYKSYTNG